jgi:sugar lactone lactonase YvrE
MNEAVRVDGYQAVLGEGPLWHAGQMLCLDIEGMVLVAVEGNCAHVMRDFGFRVTAIASRLAGGLVLASERGVFVTNGMDGPLTLIADPESGDCRTRFNEGKCDAAGRFWAGTMGFNGEPGLGSLYRINPDGAWERVLFPTTISNGIGWSPDGETFYFIDSVTGTVTAFDFSSDSGALSSARTVVTIPAEEGIPDGLAVDSRGHIWIALWDGSRVVCHDPTTGAQCDEIRLPVSRVTSCSFGGEHLDELYITTARIGLDAEALSRQPLAGSLFKSRPGVCGSPVHGFAG